MDQRFDGMEIAVFEGRFRGTFEIPHDVGAGMALFGDEEYTFSVTVVPKNASFGETKTGDPKRTNVLEIVAVRYDGHTNPVFATNGSVPQPVVEEEEDFGIDSLAGQQVFTPEVEVETLGSAPAPRVDDAPVRDYDNDPALKSFLAST